MKYDNLLKLIQLIESDKVIYQMLKECSYEVLKSIRVREYGKGSFLLEQGKLYEKLYIVAKGTVDIFGESEQGKKIFYATYKKGDYIGEMELFQRAVYLSSAESRGSVTILEVPRDVFLRWIQVDNHFNEYLIQTLCRNHYRLCANMGRNTLYPLKQRLCQYLLEHADGRGKVREVISTEMLSQQMGVTQRSVNRVMKQLKEKGIIDLDKNNVVIRDYEALSMEARQKKEEDYE